MAKRKQTRAPKASAPLWILEYLTTEAAAKKLDNKVMQALRRVSYMYAPTRKVALVDARRGYGLYQCAACFEVFGPKDVAVDHTIPVVPVDGRDSWDGVIRRMMYGPCTVLCKGCHQLKSNQENWHRRQHRKAA